MLWVRVYLANLAVFEEKSEVRDAQFSEGRVLEEIAASAPVLGGVGVEVAVVVFLVAHEECIEILIGKSVLRAEDHRTRHVDTLVVDFITRHERELQDFQVLANVHINVRKVDAQRVASRL